MDDGSSYAGRLRKRRRATDGLEEVVSQLMDLIASCQKIVIFSGSGLSANSGMSMFSTRNGLYERARQRFKIQDGIKLFSYPFYKQRRMDVQSFFAQIYGEAKNSRASPGHLAIAQLHELHKLQRHYTLNIDGLAEAVGMDTWHHEKNPEGITVEMHGNISYVVCPSCHAVEPLSGAVMATMKACQPVLCKACKEDDMRFKVMLYDDEQGDCITPEDVFERLEEDLEVAGAIFWVGISFEQSASTEYFRKVRHLLASLGRLEEVTQVIINPSDEAYFNVVSSMSKKEDVKVLDVRGTSDDILPRMVQHLHQTMGTKPDPAYSKAAAEAAEAAAAARQLQQEQAAQAEAADAAAAARKPRVSAGAIKEEPFVIDMNSAAAAALDLPPAALRYLQQQVSQQQDAAPVLQQADQQQLVLQVKVKQSAEGMKCAVEGSINPNSNDGQPSIQLHHLQGQLGGSQTNPALAEAAAASKANHAAEAAVDVAQQPAMDLGAAAAAAGVQQAAVQLLQQQAPDVLVGPPATASSGLVSALKSSPALLAALAAAGTSHANGPAGAANGPAVNGLAENETHQGSDVLTSTAAAGLAANSQALELQAASLHANGQSVALLHPQAAISAPAVEHGTALQTTLQPAAAPVGQQHASHPLPPAQKPQGMHEADVEAAAAALNAATPPVAAEQLHAAQRGSTPPANSQHAAAAAALAALATAVKTGTPPADVQQAAAAALQAIAAANGGAVNGAHAAVTPPAVDGAQASTGAA